MEIYPQLIVFDFHGTLSAHTGTSSFPTEFEKTLKKGEYDEVKINNIKNALRNYKKTSWYQAMKDSKIDSKILMPTLDDVVKFVDEIKKNSKETFFGIATMGEDEKFMFDMMKYCFESKGKESPFTTDTIVGFQTLNLAKVKSTSSDDKMPHIQLIIDQLEKKNPGLKIPLSSVVLIDDSEPIVKYMTKQKICSVLVDNYFEIWKWNKGCYEN